MKKLKKNYTILKYKFILVFVFSFLSKPLISNEITFDIQGNDFTDTDAILSNLKEVKLLIGISIKITLSRSRIKSLS